MFNTKRAENIPIYVRWQAFIFNKETSTYFQVALLHFQGAKVSFYSQNSIYNKHEKTNLILKVYIYNINLYLYYIMCKNTLCVECKLCNTEKQNEDRISAQKLEHY